MALAKLEEDSSGLLNLSSNRGRDLVVVRCGERGCGLKLAHVTATRKGPLYWASLPWSSSSYPRYGQRHRHFVAMAQEVGPELFGFAIQAGLRTDEKYYKEERGELCVELLNHPCPVALRDPLFVRCRRHLADLEVDRDSLTAAIRTAARTGKPTKLLLPERPTAS